MGRCVRKSCVNVHKTYTHKLNCEYTPFCFRNKLKIVHKIRKRYCKVNRCKIDKQIIINELIWVNKKRTRGKKKEKDKVGSV